MAKQRDNKQQRPKEQKLTPAKKLKACTTLVEMKTKQRNKGKKVERARREIAETSRAGIRRGKRKEKESNTSTAQSEGSDTFSDEQPALRVLKNHPIFKGNLPGLGSPSKKEAICKLIFTLLDEYIPGTATARQTPINNFGDVEIHSRTTYYRCNLKSAAKSLQSLSFKHEHLETLKQTPFWILFNSLYTSDLKKTTQRCHKNENDIRTVLRSYHMDTESFFIAGELRKITKTDVHLILGVMGGAIPVPLTNKEYAIPKWVRRCFEYTEDDVDTAGTYDLYKSYLFESLKYVITLNTEESIKDVGRLIHCYLLSVLLAPTKNGSIPWYITSYCETYDEIYQYDWGDYVCNMLMDQIKGSERLRSGGCTMLLLFWLCEITNLVKPVEDKAIPRYLKWDLRHLRKKIKDKDLSVLDRKYLRDKVQQQTDYEKNTYQILKRNLDDQFNVAGPTKDESIPSTEDVTQSSTNTMPEGDGCKTDNETDEGESNTFKLSSEHTYGGLKIKEATENIHSPRTRSGVNDEQIKESQGSPGYTVSDSRLNQQDDLWVERRDDDLLSNEEHVSNTPNSDVAPHLLCEHDKYIEDQVVSDTTKGRQPSKDVIQPVPCEQINNAAKIARSVLRILNEQGEEQRPECDKTDKSGLKSDQGVVMGIFDPECAGTSILKEKNSFLKSGSGCGKGFSDAEGSKQFQGGFDSIPRLEVVLPDPEIAQLKLRVNELESKLQSKQNELKYVNEKLHSCTNKIEATNKALPQLIKQKVDAALQQHMQLWDSTFGAHFQAQHEAIQKLNDENRRLVDLLNAELNPTDSQFMAKECNLQFWDTISELEITKNEKEAIMEKHKKLMERVQKMEADIETVHKEEAAAKIQEHNQQDMRGVLPMVIWEEGEPNAEKIDTLAVDRCGDIEGQGTTELNLFKEPQQGMGQHEDMDYPPEGGINTENLDTLTGVCVGNLNEECTRDIKAATETGVDLQRDALLRDLEEELINTDNLDTMSEVFAGDLNNDCHTEVTLTASSQPEGVDELARKPRTRRVAPRSSMISRVKTRTEKEERKAKQFSPQLNTRDIVDLDNHCNVAQARKKNKSKIGHKFFLNETCGAVKRISETTFANMEKFWTSDNESAIIWKAVKYYHNHILLSDIIMMLQDGRISNSVIDGWGELTLKRYGKLKGDCQTMIFGTSSWNLIHNRYSANDLSLLKSSVDKRLENEVLEDYVLLFPMLTHGRGRHDKGDHWTLMKFEVETGKWYFYNSLAPRTSKVIDCHLSRAKELVEYVEEKLKTVFMEKFPTNTLITSRINRPIVANCPQQEPGSLDCGVVVCEVIEQVVARRPILYGSYSYEDSTTYRAKMANWFMDNDDSND